MNQSRIESILSTYLAIKCGPKCYNNRQNPREIQSNRSGCLGLILWVLAGFSSLSLWALTPENIYLKPIQIISETIQDVNLINNPSHFTEVIYGENNLRFTLRLDSTTDDVFASSGSLIRSDSMMRDEGRDVVLITPILTHHP